MNHYFTAMLLGTSALFCSHIARADATDVLINSAISAITQTMDNAQQRDDDHQTASARRYDPWVEGTAPAYQHDSVEEDDDSRRYESGRMSGEERARYRSAARNSLRYQRDQLKARQRQLAEQLQHVEAELRKFE